MLVIGLLQGAPRHFFYVRLERSIPGSRCAREGATLLILLNFLTLPPSHLLTHIYLLNLIYLLTLREALHPRNVAQI